MKILIAIDGSEFSQRAIAKACDILIDRKNSAVKIISVVKQVHLTATEPFAVFEAYVYQMEKAGSELATKFVSDAEAQIRQRFPDADVQITTRIPKGSAGKTIVEEAEKWGADVIVVGSHGYDFWDRTLLGSVSGSVVHHARCSVLVVRDESERDA